MTAETELLPLGERDPNVADAMRTYARACVSSATEALRAEVAAAIGEAMQSRADAKEWQGAAEIYSDRAERLAEALRWALPLASQALEVGRMERLRCGHTDITGTYKNGTTWAGIYQEEVDAIEKARAALEQETTNG